MAQHDFNTLNRDSSWPAVTFSGHEFAGGRTGILWLTKAHGNIGVSDDFNLLQLRGTDFAWRGVTMNAAAKVRIRIWALGAHREQMSVNQRTKG